MLKGLWDVVSKARNTFVTRITLLRERIAPNFTLLTKSLEPLKYLDTQFKYLVRLSEVLVDRTRTIE